MAAGTVAAEAEVTAAEATVDRKTRKLGKRANKKTLPMTVGSVFVLHSYSILRNAAYEAYVRYAILFTARLMRDTFLAEVFL